MTIVCCIKTYFFATFIKFIAMKNLLTLLFGIILYQFLSAQHSYNINFLHDGVKVYGNLTVPAGAGKFPVIIIAPGSGPQDRDGTFPFQGGNLLCLYPGIFGDTMLIYKELAKALVDSGYAVLRYDKLEYTYSTGVGLGPITFHKIWLPVESAIKYVKLRSELDTNQIILLGHSEGSSLIPFIAKGRHDIKAMISIAGARTPIDSLAAWQYNNFYQLFKPCGATSSDSIALKALGDDFLDYFEIIRTSSWNQNTPVFYGAPASAWADYVPATDPVADNYNFDNLPTLFIGLEKDLNVPPSELIRMQQDVTITDDFWTIPDCIHYLCSDHNAHLCPVLADTILYWLRQVVTDVEEPLHIENDFIHISPNPFTATIKIEFDFANAKSATFYISDILGNLMLSQSIPSYENHFTVDLDD
jgi:pimeloyl-ACP methyl ester carboxylesterase